MWGGVVKVYLLFSGAYSDRSCVGVYSTLEKAQAQRTDGVIGWEGWPEDAPTSWESINGKNDWSGGYDIEEREVDA